MTRESAALRQRMEVLQDRISDLCGAILRISASLELDAVLREIVDSARALTDADYGCITTIDEEGRPEHFITSGITADEHRRITEWDEGPRLFEYFRDHPRVLRVLDIPEFLRRLGFSTEVLPYMTLQGTPVHHRGRHVGSFFLAHLDDGRAFTDEDEEVLVLFASQAATAIANARTYRDERRARSYLEALVDTTPIAVAVFDAKTGKMVSLNRELKRLVGNLHMPDHSEEELLEVMTCRRADGREVALTEFALTQQLKSGETVRNQEVVVSIPDGRSVRMLVNATPILSPEGEVESVVVTLQDLAPFEELERMRTEFLAIVSHELRAPLTSIKGSTATVLTASPGFAMAEMLQFFRIIDAQADQMSGLIGDLLDAGRIATGTLSVSPQPSDVAVLVDQARNTFLSGRGRHVVLVDIPPDLPRVMADRQRMAQVLNNLFTNAASHAPESSPIHVAAWSEGVHVAISISDRGKGISPEQLPHLFQKYAGVGDGAHGLRGGLGLAICKGLVEAHGGRIRAASDGEGRGARFTFTIPVAGEVGGDPTGVSSTPDRKAALREGREPQKILVVDDDPQTLRHVRDVLTASGYAVFATGDHEELSHLIGTERPSLVLLDLMLPGTDGIQLMRSVPAMADLPVIFISAYGRDETVARALGAGAADYIVKPFSPTELTARVRAVLRSRTDPEPFEFGQLRIDYDRRRVTVAGRPVELTATEYEVLRVLSARAGRVATYRSLLRQAWRRYPDRVDPKLVHAVVKRLRNKLGEDGSRAAYIVNERGVGYRMPAPGGE